MTTDHWVEVPMAVVQVQWLLELLRAVDPDANALDWIHARSIIRNLEKFEHERLYDSYSLLMEPDSD